MIQRIVPCCVLAGVLLALVFVTPAIGGGGKPADPDQLPRIEADVSWTEGTSTLRVWGIPSAPGVLRIDVAQFISGPLNPSLQHLDIPFVFDANGYFEMVTPLANLCPWGDFDLVVEAQTIGLSGEPQSSERWGMRLRMLDPAAPSTPAAPSGGSAAYAVPGTTAPLYPYTWAAVPYNGDVAYFQVAFTGIEGVIPVN